MQLISEVQNIRCRYLELLYKFIFKSSSFSNLLMYSASKYLILLYIENTFPLFGNALQFIWYNNDLVQ